MPSLSSNLLTVATVVSSASAAYQGFNYGSTFTSGAAKVQPDFEAEFSAAAGLEGTNGAFNSARVYTMVQGGTANDPISAIPAAIKTKTSLLLGLWASGGDDPFNNEIAALQKTITQYCGQGLSSLVAGISVGSEDLYRISPTGIASGELPGVGPDTLVNYIARVRDTIKGSCLGNVPIGHVDTWTAYVNGSNQALIDALDWIGMDAYPYFESTKSNPIENGKNLFQSAFDQTAAVIGGKEIWITETGWPVSGKTSGRGVPSVENARSYWTQVGCPMFGATNVWWYTLQDAAPDTPNPSFGVVGSQLSTKPLYDLSCEGVDTSPVRNDAEGNSSSVPSSGSPSSTGVGSGTGSGSESTNGPSPTPSTVQDGAGSVSVNSFAAAAIALVLAVAIL